MDKNRSPLHAVAADQYNTNTGSSSAARHVNSHPIYGADFRSQTSGGAGAAVLKATGNGGVR